MSPQRRQAVTSPQTRLAHARRRHRAAWRPPSLDPAEARRGLELYRAQRVRAVAALAALFALVFGLPLLLDAYPGLDEERLLGVPVSWLAIVVVPYPVMVAVSWWQLRRAERTEDLSVEELRAGDPRAGELRAGELRPGDRSTG